MLGQKTNGFTRNFDLGEELIIQPLRRHWIVYFDIATILAAALAYTIFMMAMQSWLRIIPSPVHWLILVSSWLYLLQVVYIRWMNNQLDVTVVTNKRILDLEQTGFLSRKISECTLSRVQEVNAQKGGILGNLLHFGDISIHTSADKSDFNIRWIHHPLTNARRIHSMVDTYRHVGKDLSSRAEPNLGHEHLK